MKNSIIKVTECLDCPFKVIDTDFDSVGNEYFVYCNLLRTTNETENIIGVFSDELFDNENELSIKGKVLENCPLKKEKIVIDMKVN